jgi:hypothetical protein
MKKIFRLSLITLSSLMLFSCTGKENSSIGNLSNDAISTKTSQEQTSSKKDSTSKKTSSSNGISSSSTSSSVDESSVSQDEVQWGEEISEMMKQYLGGKVLPYVNLGKKKNIVCDYKNSLYKSSSYLEIDGEEYVEDSFNDFETTFKSAGYSTTITSDADEGTDTLTAVNETSGLKVVLSHTVISATVDTRTYVLKAYYEPSYDESTASSSYSADELTMIHDALDDHDIPFINFGTSNLYIYKTVLDNSLRVIGWEWNDSLLTKFENAYKAAGWTVNSENGVYTATKTEDDKCALTATISKPERDTQRAYMEISYREGYNPSAASGYDSQILQDMKDNMDQHTIPYIYLGTKNPSFSFDMDKNTFKLTGGFFDNQMIADATETLSDEGWTTTEYVGTYGRGLRAYKTMDDGCYITMSFEAPYNNNKVVLYGNYSKAMTNVPTGDNAKWDDATLESMKTYFNGHTIPYFYMGSSKTTTSFSDSTSTMFLSAKTSNTYSNKIITDAADSLTTAGWTVTLKSKTSSGQANLVAEYTDSTDNSYFKITMDAQSQVTSSLIGTASCHIFYLEGYNKDSVTNGWDEGVSTVKGETTTSASMTSHFGSAHTVPYVYLGLKRYTSSWNDSSKTMTINGGNWDDRYVENAKTAITSDTDTTGTWSEVKESVDGSNNKVLTATKTYTDGAKITMTLKQNAKVSTDSFTATTITYLYNDVYGSTDTEWPSSVTDRFTKRFGSTTCFPYVYLHASNDALISSDTYNGGSSSASTSIGAGKYFCQSVTVRGGIYDTRVLTDAEAVYKANGFTVSHRTRYNRDSIEGIKTDTDGSTLRFVLMANGSGSSDVCKLMMFRDETTTFTESDYTDTEKETIKSALNNYSIPFLYTSYLNRYTISTKAVGSSNLAGVTIKTNTTKNDDNKSTYTYYYHDYFTKNKEILENDGWTCSINEFGTTALVEGSASQTILSATKVNADGSTLSLDMKYSSGAYTINVYYAAKFEIPTNGEWSDTVSTKMEENFDGNTIPYIYLGTKEETVISSLSSSHTLKLRGDVWDDSIFTNAISVLGADTTKTWTTMYYYDSTNGKTLMASGEFTKDGETHHITMKIYKDAKTGFPYLEAYYIA